MLQKAKDLAGMGFKIFPIIANGKLPAISDFPRLASSDVKQLEKWWIDPVLGTERPFNIGISTTSFGNNGEALVVVDVDNKDGKNGSAEIEKLEMLDFDFPATLTQITPTGGKHLIYKIKGEPVKQGVSVLGNGLDIRSRGGYIIGAGSLIDGKAYGFEKIEKINEAKDWIIQKCAAFKGKDKHENNKIAPESVSKERAINTAGEYLRVSAPLAIQGENGDQTTFSVICRIKDIGVGQKECEQLLHDFWNERCSPPWDAKDLHTKVDNAYRYSTNDIGSHSIEADFAEEIAEGITVLNSQGEHPFDKINDEYAFVTTGGTHCILFETKDENGHAKLERLAETSFHKKLAARVMMSGNKVNPVTRLWMNSPRRRSYNGIVFAPQKSVPDNLYNLWKGFKCEPLTEKDVVTKEMQKSLDDFLDHAFENVCDGDESLYNWLIGYFAHLIQKPYEKPLVALVFRGAKGVGKNALVERVGNLLGGHFRVASDRRYLVGNFNAHFENNLFFVLDEAFWSGDKQAEGNLKSLITGTHHFIEHKGYEAYTVNNLTRVAIVGNEEWLVPATQDERRFAVFNVGNGKKQNVKFFHDMRVNMENGGYRLLLSFLQNFDISKFNVNIAPMTKGLHDQKIASLEPFQDWLYDCLKEGTIIGADSGWPESIAKDTLISSFRNHSQKRNIKSRFMSDVSFGKLIGSWMPDFKSVQKHEDGTRLRKYVLPDLNIARADWESKIGHKEVWD